MNTLTINGLFKRFKTNNSQRKFLSIFAKTNYSKKDLSDWKQLFRYDFLRV